MQDRRLKDSFKRKAKAQEAFNAQKKFIENHSFLDAIHKSSYENLTINLMVNVP
jgi:hypothetical protein